jgi:transcriptional regulator with XRE-family HTH domain
MSTRAKLAADQVQRAMESTTPASSVDMWIGSRVRIRRTTRGMTQQDLSDLLGIDRDNLAGYEAGEERINASLLLRVGKVLEVQPDYFFRGYVEDNLKAR